MAGVYRVKCFRYLLRLRRARKYSGGWQRARRFFPADAGRDFCELAERFGEMS
jgi:hypothetical protein